MHPSVIQRSSRSLLNGAGNGGSAGGMGFIRPVSLSREKHMHGSHRMGSNRVGSASNISISKSILDLSMEPSLARPLPKRSPIKFLLVSLVILGLYGAALVMSAIALPFPTYRGSGVDWFISIGWVLFAVGLVILLGTMVALLIKKHPFYETFLLAYFISLLLFICASVLHTTRLNTSLSDFLSHPSHSSILSVQLQWLGNIVYYCYFTWILKGSSEVISKHPQREELEKYQLLLTIREMGLKKAGILEEMDAQERVKQQRALQQQLAAKHEEDAQAIWLAHKQQQTSVMPLQAPQLNGYMNADGAIPFELPSPVPNPSPSPSISALSPSHVAGSSPMPPPFNATPGGLVVSPERPVETITQPHSPLHLHPSGDASNGLPQPITPARAVSIPTPQQPFYQPTNLNPSVFTPTQLVGATSPTRASIDLVSPKHSSVVRVDDVEDD